MIGGGGVDRLSVALDPDEASAAGWPAGSSSTSTCVTTKPAALHDTIGWIDFGAGGSSYYYSRTAMDAPGESTIDGETLEVDRHGLVRPPVGRLHRRRRRRLGLVRRQPRRRHRPHALARPRRRRRRTRSSTERSSTPTARRGTCRSEAFSVEVTDRWTSPTTSADYPAGWRIELPGEDLVIDLTPDRRRPGARHAGDDRRRLLGGITGRSRLAAADEPLGGEAYVELTGYGPAGTEAP